MKTHQENFIPAFAIATPEQYECAAYARRLLALGVAANSVRQQLMLYAERLDNMSLRRQAEALRTWMDINAEGLTVAARIAELGPDWAEDIASRLETASQDLDRIACEERDDIGPSDAYPGHELIHVWSEVNSILGSMETVYRGSSPAINPAVIGKIVEPSGVFAR